MDNQVPEDVIKDRFDRLLSEVQEISKEQVKRFEGRTSKVLVEEVNDHIEGYLTGRLDSGLLVHFEGPKELIGELVYVRLDEAKGFYFMGTKVN